MKSYSFSDFRNTFFRYLLLGGFLMVTQVGWAEDDCKEKSGGFPLTNITALAEAIVSEEDVLLDDFTGVEYDSEHFEDLCAAAIKLKASTGFNVYDIGFSYISMQAENGLNNNFQSTLSELENSPNPPEKYILICYVLKEEENGEIADFLIDIRGEHGFSEQTKSYLTEYLSQVIGDYFHPKKDMFERFDADAVGVNAFLNYLSEGDEKIDIAYEEPGAAKGGSVTDRGPIVGEDHKLLNETIFISYAGYPIHLPAGAVVKFARSTINLKDGRANGLIHQFTIDNGSNIKTYRPYYKASTGKFEGYKFADPLKENNAEKELFSSNTQYSPNDNITASFGIVAHDTDKCFNRLIQAKFGVNLWPSDQEIDKAGKGVYQTNIFIWDTCVEAEEDELEQVTSPVINFKIKMKTYRPFIDNGGFIEADQKVEVPCQLKSISQQSFFDIGRGAEAIGQITYYHENQTIVYRIDDKRKIAHQIVGKEDYFYYFDEYNRWYEIEVFHESVLWNQEELKAVGRYLYESFKETAIVGTVTIASFGVGYGYGVVAEIAFESGVWIVLGRSDDAKGALIGGAAGGAAGVGFSQVSKAYRKYKTAKKPSSTASSSSSSSSSGKTPGATLKEEVPIANTNQKINDVIEEADEISMIYTVLRPDGSRLTVKMDDVHDYMRNSGLTKEIIDKFDEDLDNVAFKIWVLEDWQSRVKAWDALYPSPSLRNITDNLTHVDNYVKKNPNSLPSIKSNFENLPEANRQAFINGLKNATEDLSHLGGRGALPDEIADAVVKIADHRASNSWAGNWGYLEGQTNPVVNITNQDGTTKFWRSVSMEDAENEIHIFDAIEATGSNGNEWLRITDSEYRMLNKFADEYGAVSGGVYPDITGSLKIVSENPYCPSCQGVIQQFHEMFPNVDLILVDGVK